MMKRGLLIAVLGFSTAAARAGSVNTGTSGAQLLSVEQGARGLGMGGAFSAAADDASSLWWNPAGLARAHLKEVIVSHTAYLDNVATEYAGFVLPYAPAHGAFGASFLYMNIPGIDGYDAAGNATGKLSAGGYVGTLSYGAQVTPNMTAGASAKLLSQKYGAASGSGFAGDIGAQYRDGVLGLGLVAQNLGPSFKTGSSSDPLPRTIRGGAFYLPTDHLLLSLEEEGPRSDSARAHAGAEWAFAEGLRLRGGFQQTPNSGSGAGFTVGFGIALAYDPLARPEPAKPATASSSPVSNLSPYTPLWENLGGMGSNSFALKNAAKPGAYLISLDYAFVSNGDLSDVHRISLNVRF